MATINGLPQEGGGALKKTLLWTNLNPNNAFAAQELSQTFNFSDYDFIMFEFKNSTSSSMVHQVLTTTKDFTEKDNGYTRPLAFFGWSSTLNQNMSRFVFSNSTNKIGFGAGLIYSTGSIQNSYVIPLRIYGVKGEIK